jgi:hypothetical protein
LLLKALACVRPEVRGAARFSGAPCIWALLNGLQLSDIHLSQKSAKISRRCAKKCT